MKSFCYIILKNLDAIIDTVVLHPKRRKKRKTKLEKAMDKARCFFYFQTSTRKVLKAGRGE